MKFKHLLAIMAFIPASLIASVSYAGVMTGITAPASAAVGTPVSVTITGAGICSGGYTIHWGDGNVNVVGGEIILPHSPPSHTYTSTGTKTMSVTPSAVTCSAPPTKQIQINSKPAKFSTISSISGPNTARWGRTYRMKVLGNGKCKLRIDWGDGGPNYNANNYNLSAPRYLYHKYKLSGFPIGFSKIYTIKVTPVPTGTWRDISFCRGSASKSVRVGLVGVAPNPAIRKSPAIKKSPGIRRFK